MSNLSLFPIFWSIGVFIFLYFLIRYQLKADEKYFEKPYKKYSKLTLSYSKDKLQIHQIRTPVLLKASGIYEIRGGSQENTINILTF